MAPRQRRRRAPSPPLPAEDVVVLEALPDDEPEADNEVVEEDMGELSKSADEKPIASAGKLKLVALGRCRYSDNEGNVHNAQPGDILVDPLAADLKDLKEANLLESFDENTVAALREAVGKNKAAIKAILGL